MLCEHLWDQSWEGVTNVIEVHINRLRSKIDRGFDEPLIHTIRGRGYVLALVGYVAYYVLYRALENLGAQGALPMALAGALPNLVFAAAGLLWLWRLGRPGVAR